MKTAYAEHAKRVGKILPQDWDTVGLEKPMLPRGAKGMEFPIEHDPNYHPRTYKSFETKRHGNERNRKTHSSV